MPQQISSRRHVDRSMKGSLLFAEEVREGNRNDVCEAVETLLTECDAMDPEGNSSETSLALGLGDAHIRVGDRPPLSVSSSSSSRELLLLPLVDLPFDSVVTSFTFSRLNVLELLLGFVVFLTVALLSTTCFQFFELPGGSFFHRLTRRTQALQISPCLSSLNRKQPLNNNSYLVEDVNRELEDLAPQIQQPRRDRKTRGRWEANMPSQKRDSPPLN